MTLTPLAELLTYTQEHAGSGADRQVAFVSCYFENTDPDEIASRGPATLYAIAKAHWRLLESTPLASQAQLAKVRVFNPTLAEDGFVSDHTVVQIVHANMPFLVDSVTMTVNRSGRTAHWIVHPLMHVARDEQGKPRSATSAGSDGTVPIESLILVECDRIVSRTDQQTLVDELTRVLGDVRGTVQDWAAMLERVRNVATASAHTPLTPASRLEGIAFLSWLEDRHFTFLGARDYDVQRDADGVSLLARPESGLGILRGEVRSIETRLPPEEIGRAHV